MEPARLREERRMVGVQLVQRLGVAVSIELWAVGVDGTWQCTGNTLPGEMCAQSGDPCELDSTT